ncbi:MAG: pyruvate kinase [Ignavibacteria bacterium]|nr:pyruvate kinase [Ignavibacteria bacterium]
MRRTKIIATIGPASAGVEMLTELINAGMDVARLNFSHGTHEEHEQMIADIRAAAEKCGKSVAILLDLQGPKIRTGDVENNAVPLEDGATLIITADDVPMGNAQRVGTTYPDLVRDVRAGQTILLDDGYLILRITAVQGNDIVTTVIKGGVLKNHKGIIVPGATITAPAISQKDLDDVRFGLDRGIDLVAMSFVSSERDIIELRSAMRVFGRTVPVIAKLERAEGIGDIEDIVREADAVMVARGDLGLEMPAEQVPVLQKRIISRCNFYGKPVITATQMLESMIENPRPTRAEASDVANAVIDGTDCVMLSGETSVGRYPVEAVRTMDRIVRTAEEHFPPNPPQSDVPTDERHNVADAVGRACCVIAAQIHAAAIVPVTSSGGEARIIAKYRPSVPILALTDSDEVMRQLALVWGVCAHRIPHIADHSDLLTEVVNTLLERKLLNEGDHAVLTAGTPFRNRVPTNMLRVVRL